MRVKWIMRDPEDKKDVVQTILERDGYCKFLIWCYKRVRG